MMRRSRASLERELKRRITNHEMWDTSRAIANVLRRVTASRSDVARMTSLACTRARISRDAFARAVEVGPRRRRARDDGSERERERARVNKQATMEDDG